MPKILVTGGAGFIGSHVIDRFVAAGYDVVAIDDLSTGKAENVSPGVDLRVADIQSDEAAEIVRRGALDTIAHLAAQIDLRKSVADPIADMRTNVGGTVNLLEAVRSLPAERRPRFVFASTGGALYGNAARFPTDEESPANPDAPYGVGKLAAENYLAYYGRVWGLDTAVVRFGNVYGPRQNSKGEAGVIAMFAQRMLDNRPLTIYGSGRQTRDYVYVSDVAEAFFAAATKPLPPPGALTARAFNVGTGLETSVIELAETLSEVAGVQPVVEYAPRRPGEIERSVLDPSKAQRQLGWHAVVPLRTGLAKTYDWLSAR